MSIKTLIEFSNFTIAITVLSFAVYSIFYTLKIHKKEYVSEATQKWKRRLIDWTSLSLMISLLTYGLILLILVLTFIGRIIDFLLNLVF